LIELGVVSLEEHLSTSYDADVEYVEGGLVERDIGEWSHRLSPSNLILALSARYPAFIRFWHCVHTTSTRYRLPDPSVLLSLTPDFFTIPFS
jgi:hypothetical protein